MEQTSDTDVPLNRPLPPPEASAGPGLAARHPLPESAAAANRTILANLATFRGNQEHWGCGRLLGRARPPGPASRPPARRLSRPTLRGGPSGRKAPSESDLFGGALGGDADGAWGLRPGTASRPRASAALQRPRPAPRPAAATATATIAARITPGKPAVPNPWRCVPRAIWLNVNNTRSTMNPHAESTRR